MSSNDRAPSSSAALYTAPAEHIRQYDLTVQVPLRERRDYTLSPWVRIVANTDTEDVSLAAGIKATRRTHTDDGA